MSAFRPSMSVFEVQTTAQALLDLIALRVL